MGRYVLEVKGLVASVGENEGKKRILDSLSLSVPKGEIHLIMGPNGSGKSTLAYVLFNHPKYVVESGKIFLDGKDITNLETDERSRAGMFLALQHPTEIHGVTVSSFLRSAINFRRPKDSPISILEFGKKVEKACKRLGIDPSFISRELNVGFSGGEKKRLEVLQALVLEPKIAIFDETDSGLDLDSLKTVATTIEKMRSRDFSAIVITHNPRVLKYVKPDKIHILSGGKIVRSGGRELAKTLENSGYSFLNEKSPPAKRGGK